mmetsp:Transcript_59379/g.109818  ORF Transcript_59379/g.109818 Transcript_59379/m.109818 type:complete len:299 (-) Transcript_59379:101-997(-)
MCRGSRTRNPLGSEVSSPRRTTSCLSKHQHAAFVTSGYPATTQSMLRPQNSSSVTRLRSAWPARKPPMIALAELRGKLQEQRKRIGDTWHDDENSFGRRCSVDDARDRRLVSSRRQDTSSMLSAGGSEDVSDDVPPSGVSSFAKAGAEDMEPCSFSNTLSVPPQECGDSADVQVALDKSSEPQPPASVLSWKQTTASEPVEVSTILTPTTVGTPRSRSAEGYSARSQADTDSSVRLVDQMAWESPRRCQGSVDGNMPQKSDEENSFWNFIFPCCFTRDREPQDMPALGCAGVGLQQAS